MSQSRADRLDAIQQMSREERLWQPHPEAFVEMVEGATDRGVRELNSSSSSGNFRALAVAVEQRSGIFVWVLLERLDQREASYGEVACAHRGDEDYAKALAHGLQALRVASGYPPASTLD